MNAGLKIFFALATVLFTLFWVLAWLTLPVAIIYYLVTH